MKRKVTIEIDRCSDCKHSNKMHQYCSIEGKPCPLASIPKWCQLLKKEDNKNTDKAKPIFNTPEVHSSKWFRLRSKNPRLTENKNVSDYLESVTDEVFHALNTSTFYGIV